jgi:uncharacterized membrane protein (UPF0127 family)
VSSESKKMNLTNKTKATTIGTRITMADTSLTRLLGLAGRRRLGAGCGLLIKPSSGIHTFGMRFAIDVVALTKDLRVLRLWHALPPFRITSVSLKTHTVLEIGAGEISRCQIEVGDQLEIGRDIEPDIVFEVPTSVEHPVS